MYADIGMLDLSFVGREHWSHAVYRDYRFRSRDLEEVLDCLPSALNYNTKSPNYSPRGV
jgi:hypothetical protein